MSTIFFVFRIQYKKKEQLGKIDDDRVTFPIIDSKKSTNITNLYYFQHFNLKPYPLTKQYNCYI